MKFLTDRIAPALRRVRDGKLVLLLMIGVGLQSLVMFSVWWFQPSHVNNLTLFVLLTAATYYAVARVLIHWYNYLNIAVPPARTAPPGLAVDVMTTACAGEPYEMIEHTLDAIVAIGYPHESWLLDESESPELRALAARLGLHYVTRSDKKDAKAGNVNNALRLARGEFVTIFDPDHVPQPEFLDHVLGHFADPKVGIVQTAQAYYNQPESFVARAAAEQTYGFYGPTLMGMYGCGTSLVIGTNCTFRRAALDSIGGHAAGLAEDMHTSMLLHQRGWRSVYVPKILARGLVPADLVSYFKQQLKWSRGCFELLFEKYFRLWRGWTLRQKLAYAMIGTFYFLGLAAAVNMVVPIVFFFTGITPATMDFVEYLYRFAPFVAAALAISWYSQRWLLSPEERGLRWRGTLLMMGTWPVHLLGLLYSLLRVRVPYIPTEKKAQHRPALRLVLPQITVVVLSALGITWGNWSAPGRVMAVMTFFASVNIVFNLGVIVLALFPRQVPIPCDEATNAPSSSS